MNMLGGFQCDEIGKLCREDQDICKFGYRLYDKMKRKQGKQSEVRKSVVTVIGELLQFT